MEKEKKICLEEVHLKEEPLLSSLFMRGLCISIFKTMLCEKRISQEEYMACIESVYDEYPQ